ncbi:MAG TPA: pyridoxamine 5'-phosphate oxidase family protein [Candidatus Limnocylindrales bacterium]|nr:pyridoxamine 5'-phosphate oxidase family protein [Candidatus Limnocylindrales bacterium]
MATWEDMATAKPEMEARARELYLIEQPDAPGPAGLGYLATVRADGGPRVHPVSPAVLDGRLYVYCLVRSPKLGDLRGDGRYALHSWPKPFEDDGFDDEEFYLTGRATEVDDQELHERVSKAVGDKPESGASFELDIERAMHKARVGGLGYTVWRPGKP